MNDTYFHPTAIVETEQIGNGTKIWAYAHVMKNVSIGANCNIGDHCFIESGAVVGNNVTIKNGNMLFEGITLEDGVFVGPHVFFTNDRFPRSPRLPEAKIRYQNHDWFSPTLIKYGATLGAAAIIIAGTTIGEFAMIGAGAVITKDVAPHALMIGNPGRLYGWVCKCGTRLNIKDDNAVCPICGLVYKMLENRLVQK
jgi:acetyltransferase-like isoleucine patch superfamily enzyme